MKKILTLAVVVMLGLASCKKDEEIKLEEPQDGNKVVYTIRCVSCTATFDTMNGTSRTFQVTGFIQHAEINKLNLINLSTTGTGEIRSTIKVNDNVVHDEISLHDGNTSTVAVKVF